MVLLVRTVLIHIKINRKCLCLPTKQVYNFIKWCQEQDWYTNTTIVLVGDHPTMAQSYIKDIPSTYQRTTYNCFINSKIGTTQIKNRQFTHMDMYPTTLTAMGFKIYGNKLGFRNEFIF